MKILERNLKITSYYNSHNAGVLWNTRRRISKDYRVVTDEWEGCQPCCTPIVKIRPVQSRCFRWGGGYWLICFIYWGKIRAQYGTFLHLNCTFNYLESNSLGKRFRLPPNSASWRSLLSWNSEKSWNWARLQIRLIDECLYTCWHLKIIYVANTNTYTRNVRCLL